MRPVNLTSRLPPNLEHEVFEPLVRREHILIERIISRGHTSPAEGWHRQERHEWVLVLQGAARLEFDDGGEAHMRAGDALEIPAGVRHRVSWTDPETETIWVAVHY